MFGFASFSHHHHSQHHWPWWKKVPPTLLDTSLDPTASVGGEIYQGSGNNDDNFIVQRNLHEDIEAGFRLHYRQGENISPHHIDKHGMVHYYAPAGMQVADPGHDVPGANPNRWAWSYGFSIDSAIDGSGKTILQHLDEGTRIFLERDLDPTAREHFQVLELKKNPASQSGYGWDDPNTPFFDIPDDEGPIQFGQITQNDQNGAFTAALDYDLRKPGIQTDNNNVGAEHEFHLFGVDGHKEIFHLQATVHTVEPSSDYLLF